MTVSSVTTPIVLPIYSATGDGQPPWSSIEPQPGPGKLAAPVLSVGTPGSTSIPLTWTFTDDGQTGFEIERSPNGTDGWAAQTSAGAAARSATASGLTAETDYWFRIRAVDSGVPSRNSNWSNVVTGRTAVAPPMPTGRLLNDGYWLPQNMPMRVITQRPEAGENAAHLWAHPDMPYDHAILVQGGAPPFWGELQEAPPWMDEIQFLVVDGGELKPHKMYLRLYGANPTDAGQPPGGWVVRYRIYGQDYGRGSNPTTYVEVSYTIQVDANKFLFIATNGNNANAGTLASPKADFNGWYKGDVNDGTYFGKIVVFRGGDYDVIGDVNEGGNARINSGKKPQSFIGYADETINWGFATGAFNFWDGVNDVLFQNINIEGSFSKPDSRNFAFYAVTPQSRVYFDRTNARNITPGTSGTDNPGVIWRSSAEVRNSDWGVSQVIADTAYPSQNGPFLISLEQGENVVLDQITFINWAGAVALGPKAGGASRNWSWRWVDGWRVNDGSAGSQEFVIYAPMNNGTMPSVQAGNFEWWYCRANMDIDSLSSKAIEIGQPTGTPDPAWINRCSIRGASRVWGVGQYSMSINKSIIEGTLNINNGTISENDNRKGVFGAGYFDPVGNVTGAASGDMGMRGAQIANNLMGA